MRYKPEHFENTFFDRKVGKINNCEIPIDCISCVRKLLKQSNFETKNKIKENLRVKWGVNKFNHINSIWKWF